MADSCLNCTAPLPEPRPRYCGACGQETNVKPPTVGEFIQQFGGAYFSTEGALWRTLALLLLKPGELTRRYLAGRRKHYVLPLRLYLTISLLTLLALRLTTPFDMKFVGGDRIGEIGREVSRDAGGDAGREVAPETGREPGAPQVTRPPSFLVLDFGDGRRAGTENGRFFCERLPAWLCARLQARLDLDAKGLRQEIRRWPERFVTTWGTAMFLLVPIFALLQSLVYLGRGLRYTEHLVFTLHVHSFWFLAIALAMLPLPGLGAAAAVAMPVHALIAARRVYGGGWWATLWRALVVAALYGVVLGIAVGVVAVWAFFFS